MTNPKEGVAARCQYLPTIADVHAVLREHKARREQFQPAHTNYHRLGDENGPWDRETDYERKRRVVRECLGYTPDDQGRPAAKRTFTPPSPEEVGNLKLKTPAAPPSRHLIALLQGQGWPFIPDTATGNET